MTPTEIKRAGELLSRVNSSEVSLAALKPMKVVAFELGTTRSGEPMNVHLSQLRSGTGTLSSLGLPDGLSIALQEAACAWLQAEIDEMRRELKNLGVSLHDE